MAGATGQLVRTRPKRLPARAAPRQGPEQDVVVVCFARAVVEPEAAPSSAQALTESQLYSSGEDGAKVLSQARQDDVLITVPDVYGRRSVGTRCSRPQADLVLALRVEADWGS